MSRVDPSIASGCPSLGKLDLGDNVVSDRGSIAAIAECVQLKWLSLANCGLGGAGLAPCAQGKARQVGGGGGENERPDKKQRGKQQKGRKAMGGKACRMPNMRVLNVSGNELESLQGVNGMANLGALIANENRVESMEPLAGMTRLNTVVLSSNRVASIGEELAGMTELEREEILADRRDARAKIQDRKAIIQMAREKKEREAGGKKKFKPSDARKSSRAERAEDAKGKSSKAQALADIAKKKKDASSRRRADRDDDDDDDDDEYDDDDDVSLEDEEELTGILPTKEKRLSLIHI